jgi:hypothetical protein
MEVFSRSRMPSRSKVLIKRVPLGHAIAHSVMASEARAQKPGRDTFVRLREEEARRARRHPGCNHRDQGRT